MKNRFLLLFFLFAIGFFPSGHTLVSAAEEKDALTAKQKRYLPLLTDEAFMKLSFDSAKWQNRETTHIPAEIAQHKAGVFRMIEIIVPSYWEKWGGVAVFGKSEIRVIDTTQSVPPQMRCQQIAADFLQRQFPDYWSLLGESKPFVIEPLSQSRSQRGIFEFIWSHLESEEKWMLVANIKIRQADGNIVGFSVNKQSYPPHKISLEKAKQIAVQFIEKQSAKTVTPITGSLDAVMEYPDAYWHITIRTKGHKTGILQQCVVRVNADSGAVFKPERIKWNPVVRTQDIDPRLFDVDAHTPTWTKLGLAYVASHLLKDVPLWAPIAPHAMLRNAQGKITYLSSDLAVPTVSISSSVSSSWSWLQQNDWTYAFDLSTGTYRVLGMPERAGDTPAIDTVGKWAVVSGTGRDRDSDLDLMPDDLSSRGVQLGVRGRLVSKGDDHHPIFTPDNKSLLFVTTTYQKDKITHALRRLPASLVQTKKLVFLKPNQVETIIPQLPGDVERLSIYPSGQKLLLQARNGMFVLGVADKKVTPVVLKNLKDAEVNAAITETRDGWAGPGEGEVTFSGKTTDKEGKVRWRIYSCKFNGTSLKAWTPKENQPVEAYKFPAAPDGKTAIDLAKEWALQEIKFEDEMKRRSG